MLDSCYKTVALASLCLPGVSSRFLGPMDPAPVDISGKDSIVRATWENITSKFDQHFSGKEHPTILAGLNKHTFSLGLFSTRDSEAAGCLQYHHTGLDVKNSSNGVDTVNGESIYRVASLSRLFTVFAGLIELKPQAWSSPLAEIFPEIAGLPNNDPIRHIDWHAVTPLSLASQISGVPRDGKPFDAGDFWYTLLAGEPPVDPATLGFPSLNIEEVMAAVPCKDFNCSAVDYIKGLQGPTFMPWQTPGYADTGFILLGQAISRLTSYVVVAPLSGFAVDGGITSASGGVFSTTNDLAKLGVGILNSILLPADQTRKWMKPSTFMAHPDFAQGMGWEISRYTHRDTGHITDLYTKLGDSGSYSSYLVLIPDYDVGFSVLQESGIADAAARSAATQLLADIVSEAILPALQAQAAVEARRNFAGDLHGRQELVARPGLQRDGEQRGRLDFCLVHQRRARHDGAIDDAARRHVAGFATCHRRPGASEAGVFPGDASRGPSVATYGGQGFGTFIFNVSGQGEATAVTPAFLRKTYRKQN
ncbi:hypothetical protein PG994_011742 [Apiospora phragmitis]|uniref:Beta-lactamase-related domain-containing protein n=1 Tax=Apiospora phragmitis TaxID=2905665 RepID=A0ABR1TTT7_9PEZI